MKMCVRIFLIGIVCLLMPGVADAQIVNRIRSLHEVLETLYDDMMPLCSRHIGVGRGIAGFGATWYILYHRELHPISGAILPEQNRLIFILCSDPLYSALPYLFSLLLYSLSIN